MCCPDQFVYAHMYAMITCHVEKSRDQLKESKDLAEQYRSKEVEFLEKTVKLQMYYKGVCEQNVEALESQITELNKKLEHENGKVATFEEEVAKLKVCRAAETALVELEAIVPSHT